jgi:hypothetical protein
MFTATLQQPDSQVRNRRFPFRVCMYYVPSADDDARNRCSSKFVLVSFLSDHVTPHVRCQSKMVYAHVCTAHMHARVNIAFVTL